ncbi:energy transducer TonB [Sphingomonas sp.]|uniref:energy transducer TonB n=1 Tax=Sphingomonas sp. TaxID=28214 RepID=UPI00286CA392|nr:energy transducer TonB [Sphingomonas sp.]
MRRSITDRKDRVRSAVLVAIIHLALGWALVTSLGYKVIPRADEALKLFNLTDQPPPITPLPEQTRTETRKPKDPEGAAAPPALKNSPTEVVAPKVEPLRPPPLPAAPVPGLGSAPAAGAAPTPGPGTGRGGVGNGLGSGMSGYGNGGGGNGGRASPPVLLAGNIDERDYPPSALNTHAQGVVLFAFTVAPTGLLSDCRIVRSSGNRALDDTTCRLAMRRLRYRPAVDTAGNPVPAQVRGEQSWELGPEQELPAEDERR